MIVVGCMNMLSWVANQLTYHLGSWMMMHWFMIGLLLIVALTVYVLTRNVRRIRTFPEILHGRVFHPLFFIVNAGGSGP